MQFDGDGTLAEVREDGTQVPSIYHPNTVVGTNDPNMLYL